MSAHRVASVGGDFGAVASTHWLSSASAMSVLERGGNAFDAAAAGAFVLHVAEPDQNGIGGEVPILTWTARDRRVHVVCGQGPTPAAATPARFRALGHELIPGTGVLPACVPGAFDAWMLLLREYGTWRIADVLEYAIGYAERGVLVTRGLARRIGGVEHALRTIWPTSGEVYLRNGPPSAGDRLGNPALARTLKRIVSEAVAASADRDAQIEAARRSWASGFVADAVFAWLDGRAVPDLAGGTDVALLASDDWSAYRARIEEPVSVPFGDVMVFKAQAWSQAPSFLEMLNLLSGTAIGSLGHNTAPYIHLVVEASKLALADREGWYGDPDFADVPIGTLLSEPYAAERRRLIGERASMATTPGAPDGRTAKLPSLYDRPTDMEHDGTRQAFRSNGRGGDTAHISVIDRAGNVASAMPSGGWLQASPVIPEVGFALGTRAQMMWLEDGLPNSLQPRKRPRTTLSPTLVLGNDGLPTLAFGSPGGDAQDQWGIQFFLAHMVCGLTPQEAVERPTFQSMHVASSFWPRTRKPGVLQVENDLDGDVISALRSLGHSIELVPSRSQGWTCVVHRDMRQGFLSAAASPRGERGWALAR